jgi:hypothetical protein
MDIKQELILHAAVKTECGQIIFGKCHADCFHKGSNIGYKMSQKADDQGFLSNKANYLTREEAAKIAIGNGQIDTKTSYLFSEDLWSPRYNGKYSYDDIKGYVLDRRDDYYE